MGLRNLNRPIQNAFTNEQAQNLWQQNPQVPSPTIGTDLLPGEEFVQPSAPQAPVVINNNPPMLSETQTVTTKKAPTGYEKKIEKSIDKQIAATQKVEELKAINAENEAINYENVVAENTNALTQMEAKQKEYNDNRLKLEDNLKQARQDYTDAKIDPNRWVNATDGRRVLSAIAAGLGAFSGNKNYALDIINNTIQRDIDLQMMDINKKKENVSLIGNDLARLKQTFQDENQAITALKVMKIEAVQSQINAMKAKSQSPLITANAEQLVAGLEVDKNKLMSSLVNAPTTQTTTVNKPMGRADTKEISDLRKEYIARPEIKDLQIVQSAYSKLKGTPPGPKGDIALIYQYMKILDPNSVVREGEIALQNQARSVPTRWVGKYNKALKGETLTESERQEIREVSQQLYKDTYANVKPINDEYTKLAKAYGIDPSLVLASPGLSEVTNTKPQFGKPR